MLLADHAAVAEGKLYVSGAGWSITGPIPVPSAIALKLDVPWDRTNTTISFYLRLAAEDGQPIVLPGPAGEPQPVEIGGEFEVGRPPGLKKGHAIDVPMAFPIAPLPLPAGRRYVWELWIDGETNDDWHLPFYVRDEPPTQYVVDTGPAQ